MDAPREIVPVPYIEGMAAVGLIEKYWKEECIAGRRSRIVVLAKDGKVYATRCIDERAVKRVVLVLEEYKRLSGIIVGKAERG